MFKRIYIPIDEIMEYQFNMSDIMLCLAAEQGIPIPTLREILVLSPIKVCAVLKEWLSHADLLPPQRDLVAIYEVILSRPDYEIFGDLIDILYDLINCAIVKIPRQS